ncbi:MAG: isochorismatase family protein [Alphaproteobacteria bacterium]|nr:isochorismatase family protein [Alphaproteobacteria bacterium]
MMKKALLIIDVQKSAVVKPEIAKNIEKLQYEYDVVFVSKFTNQNSPLLNLLNWSGYDDETLAFKPKDNAIIYTKTGYSSYLPEMKEFDEIHICGFDTDACVYKTAMDLAEIGVRPVVLKDYCYSANQEFHDMGLKLLQRNIGIENIK